MLPHLPPALLALLLQTASMPQWVQPLILYVGIGAIFYFILLRPQQQQRKQLEATLAALKKGDEVVTAGGVVGEVVAIKQAGASPAEDDRITLRSGESRFLVERRGIVRVVSSPAASATPAA